MLPPLSEIHVGIIEATILILTLMFCVAIIVMKGRYLWNLAFGSKEKKRKGKRKRKRVTNVQINVAVVPYPRDRDDIKLPSPEERCRLDENRRKT